MTGFADRHFQYFYLVARGHCMICRYCPDFGQLAETGVGNGLKMMHHTFWWTLLILSANTSFAIAPHSVVSGHGIICHICMYLGVLGWSSGVLHPVSECSSGRLCPYPGTLKDDRVVLYKTKSLDGTKPNTNPNPNPKLTLILTLFSLLFFEHRPIFFKLAPYPCTLRSTPA